MSANAAHDQAAFAAFLLRARAAGVGSKRLIAAIESTPRRAFVPAEHGDVAYSQRMLPIACGETIEGLDFQALSLEQLSIEEGHRVLEIGTGSGYTAAVMARLAKRVTTVDRYKTLCETAGSRLKTLGLDNVIVKKGDAHNAVQGEGPYDRIIVWAAFEAMPRHFADLLASNGVMIAPIGGAEEEQTVARLVKIGSRFERQDFATARLQHLASGVAAVL